MKVIRFIISLFTIISLFGCSNNGTQEDNSSDSNNQESSENSVQSMFSYYLTDEGYVLRKFDNNDNIKVVEIPSMYEGKPVVAIAAYAFAFCNSLTKITIPNSVTSIEGYAFCECSSLESINIPNSVTNIGYFAFLDCVSLESIIIPSSVTSIGYYAFGDCNSLTIYCESASEPEGWYDVWNDDRPVYWGDEWHYENGVPTLN